MYDNPHCSAASGYDVNPCEVLISACNLLPSVRSGLCILPCCQKQGRHTHFDGMQGKTTTLYSSLLHYSKKVFHSGIHGDSIVDTVTAQ